MNVTIKNGNSLQLLKSIPSESVDCMVTDPPYGLAFMNKDWDKAVPDVNIWKECLRVMKPGAFAFVMCSPRSDVQAEMVIKLKEAGFEVGFTPIYWVYASGFPKSMNISRSVDRKLGYERKITGTDQNFGRADSGIYQMRVDGVNKKVFERYDEPSSEEAKKLDGSYAGFQPKPAVEVIIVVMKPLSEKTYIDQALKNGKGITWLDDGRIPYDSNQENTHRIIKVPRFNGTHYANGDHYDPRNEIGNWEAGGNTKGRFPANLLVQDDVLDIGKITKSRSFTKKHESSGSEFSLIIEQAVGSIRGVDDSGDLSRYFSLDAWYSKNIEELPDYIQRIFPFLYVPKASSGERNEDLDGLEFRQRGGTRIHSPELAGRFPDHDMRMAKNIHPTVKPIKLMTYLITLASRDGDTVIDPFMGSGTTGVATSMLNRDFVGFEIDGKYFEIAEERISSKQHPAIETFFNESEVIK